MGDNDQVFEESHALRQQYIHENPGSGDFENH
jgi:hypothetical protein